jgi:transglutaminase-like putative cysteine protease
MKKILFSLLLFPLLGACTSSSDDAAGYLAFLYRYMPLPDSVDYSREFWKRNVETSLRARREMPWGPAIPEREWRHFVLPVRVNNENLDDARTIIYNELKDRVKLMPMRDAILWVNHWCHEHVTYQPSDSRTSSPLATMRSAIGRCGEESTFTVAALRAVGIPARQVYTPRWAHTDDNHAGVEAWADGQWDFMGACEPEPVLNL